MDLLMPGRPIKNTRRNVFVTSDNNNTISKAQYGHEVNSVWVLDNWEIEFEALKSRAECFISLGNGLKLRLFLKDVCTIVGELKTEYLSLCVTASHIKNLDIGIKVSLEVGYLGAVDVGSGASRSQRLLEELNYPFDFLLAEEAPVIEIKNVNDHHEQVVIDKFLPLSITKAYNTQFPFTTQFKKPKTLKFGITAKLLKHAVSESVYQGSKHSNLPIARDFMLMLRNEENYSDIKLETKERFIVNAHKFILAARSPVFRAQIEKRMKMNDYNGVISVDMDIKTLEVVVTWMYSGEFHENPEIKLEDVLRAAVVYELKELLDILDKKMIQICTVENMLHLMQTAKTFKLSEASKNIAEFIKTNVDKMVV
ncbi:unnamed protein product [Orchesella dallaii]|uniref:BTB domain-containing protein n=1 Tax=Orchesella dallaii TaxID=48710 RepID=A0ABP1QIR5_9HEXA